MVAVLDWLRRQAATRGTTVALVDGPLRLTFAGLQATTSGLGELLRDRGVDRGDRVGLIGENSAAFVAAYLGILESGAILVPLNPATPAAVLATIIDDTGMRAIVADSPRRLDGVIDPDDIQYVSLGTTVGDGASAGSVQLALLPTAATERSGTREEAPPSDLQSIVYTSGTTGRPKGVMLTAGAHRAIAEAGCDMIGLGDGDRVGIIVPLFHLYALREVDAAMRAGASLVLARSLIFPAAVLRQLHQERVTYLSGVPAAFALFVERYESLLGACAGHLRAVTLGTAPCPPALAARLRMLLPESRVILTYGLTEASRVCYRDVDAADDRPGSIGRPYPGVELRTVDEHGALLPPTAPGRIAFRTAMAASGYWRRAEATRALHLTDGWMLSPDHGVIDDAGFLTIHGRVDNVINSGGEKVSPDEVEAALRTHPRVADCAVLSVADPNGHLGEIVLAVVVTTPGAVIDADELVRLCASRLESHKIPRAIRFADSLPRTALGKVDRERLRATSV